MINIRGAAAQGADAKARPEARKDPVFREAFLLYNLQSGENHTSKQRLDSESKAGAASCRQSAAQLTVVRFFPARPGNLGFN
jgi:hypothetical protein